MDKGDKVDIFLIVLLAGFKSFMYFCADIKIIFNSILLLMNSSLITIIVLAVIIILVAYSWYSFRAKHRIHFSEEQIKKAVLDTFDENDERPMPKEKFVNKLKKHLSCTHKEALYFAGTALKSGYIEYKSGEYILPMDK